MQTTLAEWIRQSPEGVEADRVLRACVHCGFCSATCPTYQILGDELDSPRGRIYQIKAVLEGERPTRATQVHLDRCLTCLSCETTCPSGVEYRRLLEIGRQEVDRRVQRPWRERLARALIRETVSRRSLFALAVTLGRRVRPWLPARWRQKLPARRGPRDWPHVRHERRVIFLAGCAQEALLPSVDRAAARVLDRLGVSVIVEARSGCCGALRAHLSDLEGARDQARRNIDAWWPHLEAGAEALVMTASGCGIQVKDYGHLLAHDPAYADRAALVSRKTVDLIEWIEPELPTLQRALSSSSPVRVAFQSPCTLQHGQKLRGRVEASLRACGAALTPVRDAHLCCGSAGSYSLLQPALAAELRARKLAALGEGQPEMILSANVGCLSHLEPAASVPVRHWIEWLDERLATSGR
jgi:glycolate oxidase iron-sulfur subunit